MDVDLQAAIAASIAEQTAGQLPGSAGNMASASNVETDGGEDYRAEDGRTGEAPANAIGAAQTARETEGCSERGGSNTAGAHQSNTQVGGTTRKRLLNGYAAQAAARHRQRVALQQAARQQQAEEGVT